MHTQIQRRPWIIALIVLVIAITAWPSFAQSGGGYDLTWSTIDGGGGTSSNSGYALAGTIGQAEAGVLSGGGYTLNSGFWPGSSNGYRVFLPLIIK
jgi:hypothetical protein